MYTLMMLQRGALRSRREQRQRVRDASRCGLNPAVGGGARLQRAVLAQLGAVAGQELGLGARAATLHSAQAAAGGPVPAAEAGRVEGRVAPPPLGALPVHLRPPLPRPPPPAALRGGSRSVCSSGNDE